MDRFSRVIIIFRKDKETGKKFHKGLISTNDKLPWFRIERIDVPPPQRSLVVVVADLCRHRRLEEDSSSMPLPPHRRYLLRTDVDPARKSQF